MRYNSQTQALEPVGVKDWWSDDVIGDDIGFLVGLGAMFAILVLVIELSEGYLLTFFSRLVAGGASIEDEGADAEEEDEDVAAERRRVEAAAAGGFTADRRGEDIADTRDGVVLDGITKTFGVGRGAKKAVRSLAVGMPRGQCFGLLGINGGGQCKL